MYTVLYETFLYVTKGLNQRYLKTKAVCIVAFCTKEEKLSK